MLELDGAELPGYDADVLLEDKVVGRVTSATRDVGGAVVALAYVRREVPEDAELALADKRPVRQAG